MQISRLYSLYDRKAQYYLPVFNMRSDADAIRQFSQIVTASDTPVAQYPADYDLVRLGTMDLESGLIEPEYPVGTVINGFVALENARVERARYAKALDNPQADIEDFITGQNA